MKYLFTTLFSVFIFGSIQGQDAIVVFPDEVVLEKVQRPSISMILDTEVSPFVKAWRKHLSKVYKLKTRERRGVISAKAANFSAISDKTLDFYTIVKDHEVGIRVDVVVALGYDVYLSSTMFPDSYRNMEKILNDFSRDYLKKNYNDLLKDKQKAVGKIEKDIAKQSKTIAKLKSSIEKDSKNADKLLKKVESNNAELEEISNSLPALEESLRLKKLRLIETQRKLQQVQ